MVLKMEPQLKPSIHFTELVIATKMILEKACSNKKNNIYGF
jgi:hypothetical protein